MKTEGAVEISLPADVVFRLTTERVEDWSETVVREIPVPGTPKGVGHRCQTITQSEGRRMAFDTVVTDHDPPKSTRFKMTGKQFDIDVSYQFRDLGDATRVTQISIVTPKSLLKLTFWFIGPLMKKASCKAVQDELENLKRFCESQREFH